jgi:starvation-inducible DNA-binding protein
MSSSPTSLKSNVSAEVARLLAVLLADTYLLYVKTQNFHWNVIDSRFYSLHQLFQKQYEELAEAIDEIAERIRMLGKQAPGSMQQFQELSNLQETTASHSGDEMMRKLANDHAVIIEFLNTSIATSQELGDEGSADLMIQRLRAHDKQHWMLKSHLKV